MGQTIFCLFCILLLSFEKCVTNFLGAENALASTRAIQPGIKRTNMQDVKGAGYNLFYIINLSIFLNLSCEKMFSAWTCGGLNWFYSGIPIEAAQLLVHQETWGVVAVKLWNVRAKFLTFSLWFFFLDTRLALGPYEFHFIFPKCLFFLF